MKYDVIVIGAGFAGLSSSLFTRLMCLKTLVLETESPPKLWSYPRRDFLLEGISGAELIERMLEQAKRLKVEIHAGEKVIDLDLNERRTVKTIKRDYTCSALILATGARWKFLKVPGETWLARGTSYCALCDGQFFEECGVIVVGSQAVAAQEALTMSQTARSVTLVPDSGTLQVGKSVFKELKRRRVKIMRGYRVEAIERGEIANNVKVRRIETGETSFIEADGIFIALGVNPAALNVEKAGVKTHRQGGILVDSRQQTSVDGVFAAGDCTCGGGFHITSCIGDGTRAGLAAYLYVKRLRKKKKSSSHWFST